MAKVIVSRETLTRLAAQVFEERIEGIIKKNHDYGDAWQENGPFTPLLRIKEKLFRVETLSDGRDALVLDENVDQNIGEVWDYALLWLLWRQANAIVAPRGVMAAKNQMSFAEVEAAKAAWEDILSENPYLLFIVGGSPYTADEPGPVRYDPVQSQLWPELSTNPNTASFGYRTATDSDGATDPGADTEQPASGDCNESSTDRDGFPY